MARPQSPDYDKRREAILDAAARLFAARGFSGASMADLAKACGTSKSLVYHYFPSKDDVLYAVMTSHLDDLVAAAEGAAQSGDAKARLHALTRAFMRLYVGAEDRHKVLLNELQAHSQPCIPILLQISDSCVNTISLSSLFRSHSVIPASRHRRYQLLRISAFLEPSKPYRAAMARVVFGCSGCMALNSSSLSCSANAKHVNCC